VWIKRRVFVHQVVCKVTSVFQILKSCKVLEELSVWGLSVLFQLKCEIYRTSQPIKRTVIFLLEILEKNNDECILILVIYWKETGLLHTKISNHNIIYSSQKSRKSSSLPLKSSSWLFSIDASLSSYKRCTGIYKFGNNTYPRRIRRRSNSGHIFRGKKVHLMGREIRCLKCYNTQTIQLDLFLFSITLRCVIPVVCVTRWEGEGSSKQHN